MVRLPGSADDPRAPTLEAWARLTPEERARVVAALPTDDGGLDLAYEGQQHREEVDAVRGALRACFDGLGRRVFLASNLTVYYPGERRFAPDVLAVFDVDPHSRERWVVAEEGRGLDWALEVAVSGDRRKDCERNVAWYGRLGIPEYFLYDRGRQVLYGFRLAGGGDRYERIEPVGGQLPSRVLGLGLAIAEGRLRFYLATAPVPDLWELRARVERLADEQTRRAVEAEERAQAEARRAQEEAQRAQEEARRAQEETRRAQEETRRAQEEAGRREAAERRLAEVMAELERFKRERESQ